MKFKNILLPTPVWFLFTSSLQFIWLKNYGDYIEDKIYFIHTFSGTKWNQFMFFTLMYCLVRINY